MPYNDIQRTTSQNRFLIHTVKVNGVVVIQTQAIEDDEPTPPPDFCPDIPKPGNCFSSQSENFCGQPDWCKPGKFNCPAVISEWCIGMAGNCYYDYFRTIRTDYNPVTDTQICECVYHYSDNECEPFP